MFRVRPSKPAAILTAILGTALLVYGGWRLSQHDTHGFVYLWLVFGVAIIGFNLWAAFGKSGATERVEREPGDD